MVGPAVLAEGCVDPERHARRHADDDAERRKLDRGREDPADLLDHRPVGNGRGAEVALQDAADVAQELHRERLVEPKLLTRRGVGLGRGLVADDRHDGIDRHDAADDEGDEQKPRERQRQSGQGLDQGRRTRARPRIAPRYFFSTSR